jgi:hypothetical protein
MRSCKEKMGGKHPFQAICSWVDVFMRLLGSAYHKSKLSIPAILLEHLRNQRLSLFESFLEKFCRSVNFRVWHDLGYVDCKKVITINRIGK